MAQAEDNIQQQTGATGGNVTLGSTQDRRRWTQIAFPKYCGEAKCNANSASAALNKWLKPRVPEGCVIHSFRHSLRDRLRAIECPADIIDAIGGWTTEGVGHQYGKGHSLTVTHGWMERFQRN